MQPNAPVVLAIETSCDETAVAIASDSILASEVASQTAMHEPYGGVVPEVASRLHLTTLQPLIRRALESAGLPISAIDAFAATAGPGLATSLMIGLAAAKALAIACKKPFLAVNHIEGHLLSPFLGRPVVPSIGLVVSGGHTLLARIEAFGAYTLLGRTQDDAAGEAFDKVGKLLGFGYPGGPLIDRLAPYGNPAAVPFTFARMKGNALDFSFSGLKTAVLRWVEAHGMETEIAARRALGRAATPPATEDWLAVTPPLTLDLLASFQRAVIKELLVRAASAAERIGARALIVSGGVASNTGLRAAAASARLPYPVFFPSPGLSTDNAAMIAAAAFPKFERSEFAALDILAQANLTLA